MLSRNPPSMLSSCRLTRVTLGFAAVGLVESRDCITGDGVEKRAALRGTIRTVNNRAEVPNITAGWALAVPPHVLWFAPTFGIFGMAGGPPKPWHQIEGPTKPRIVP